MLRILKQKALEFHDMEHDVEKYMEVIVLEQQSPKWRPLGTKKGFPSMNGAFCSVREPSYFDVLSLKLGSSQLF